MATHAPRLAAPCRPKRRRTRPLLGRLALLTVLAALGAWFLGLWNAASALPVDEHPQPSAPECQIGRSIAVDGATKTTAFPLKVKSGARYIEDAAGKPFFMQGDTAWSLIAQLNREEAEDYLQDRRRRGFNTLLVNLVENRFANNAPANVYWEQPFLEPGDFATPNEKYFAHADWVLSRAQELGFLVLLTPAYAGNQGGAEGWYEEMTENGPDKLHAYGRYLGRRFRNLKNVLWLHGGDYDPPDKDLVRAIAAGIREIDPAALHSAHGNPESAALEYWRGEPWLTVNTVYTYQSVVRAALEQYEDPAAMPFFLIESAYENEHDANESSLRMQAYEAALSGATGHIFGNNPIWHFDGPGLYSTATSWRQAMGSRGAQSMTHLCSLFASVDWWQLEPDVHHKLLINGSGVDDDARAAAALAHDRSFAMVYLPSRRTITLDMTRLSGSVVDARWYDPASGRYAPVKGAPFRNQRLVTLTPSSRNSSGFGDWLLELRARPQTAAAP
jgi:hypothetical protein